jgi:hypothetical protein
MAQVCTLMQECATVVMAGASKWIYSINQEFLELKSYLCTQIFDQARHIEALRKRALAGGQGLKRASVAAEQALKELLSAETYPETSVGCNLLLGSFQLGVYRHVAAVATSMPDQRLFRRMIQDAARVVAYGAGQLRYHLTHQPRQASVLHEYLDNTEHCLLGLIGSQECLEPLIILSGGGTNGAQLHQGSRRVSTLLSRLVAEYLERCEQAGLADRSQRSRLPKYLQQLGI